MDVATNLVINLVLCMILFISIYSLMNSTSRTENKIKSIKEEEQ